MNFGTDLNREVDRINLHKDLKHPHLYELLHYSTDSQFGLRNKFEGILLLFPELFQNLEKDIIDMTKQQTFFEQYEIWFLLNALVQVGAYFENAGIPHGDVRPHNVICTKNSYQLVDPLFLTRGRG